jgi:hypothetical protein
MERRFEPALESSDGGKDDPAGGRGRNRRGLYLRLGAHGIRCRGSIRNPSGSLCPMTSRQAPPTPKPTAKDLANEWARIRSLQENGPYLIAADTIDKTIKALEAASQEQGQDARLKELSERMKARQKEWMRITREDFLRDGDENETNEAMILEYQEIIGIIDSKIGDSAESKE